MAQKIDDTQETASLEIDPNKLRFEGTVELGGTVTGQMLGILFGPDSDVNGRLRFGGPVQIDGTFRGAIATNDSLVIGEHARIDADVTCGSAVIRGTITGDVLAKESVALESHAHVKGDITSPSLSMERGAIFEGASRMEQSPTPTRSRRRG